MCDHKPTRPLAGQRIVVTRTRAQASKLRDQLEQLGATVIEAPTIEVHPPDNWQSVLEAVRSIGEHDWLVLTSVNGVKGLAEAMQRLSVNASHLAAVKIAVVGPATKQALVELVGVEPNHMPQRQTSNTLADELIAMGEAEGKRFLLLRGDLARTEFAERLQNAGAEVSDLTIYQTRIAASLPEHVVAELESGRVDWITFTSSSTAQNLVTLLGDRRGLLDRVKLASIGPQTSQTMRELGLTIAFEATTSTIDGLVEALVAAVS